ncbi:MAG: heme o synthase [Thermofilum sp.]
MTLVRDLSQLFKIKQTLLLLLTGVFAYVAGSHGRIDFTTLLLTSLSIFLSVSGTTGFNMVLDADIDAAMFRTRGRPLPAGRMTKREATAASASALAAGLLLAYAVNPFVLVAGLMGFLIDILAYTVLLKRRSPWSVVVGGFAGGMPALGGWAAATGGFGTGGLLLMLLVALWSCAHIWSLATYYSEDYRRAGVPMLPVVYGDKAGVVGSLAAVLAIAIVTLLLVPAGLLGPGGAVVSLAILSLSAGLLAKALKTGEFKVHAYKAFKVVNMYMAVVFLCVAVNSVLMF